MKKYIFYKGVFGVLLLIFFIFSTSVSKAEEENDVNLYFFHTEGCPHCKAEIKFLNKIKDDYSNLKIHSFLLNEEENITIFKKVIEKFNLSGGVPLTLIGDIPIVGYNNEAGIGRKIKQRIEECSDEICQSFLDKELGLVVLSEKSSGSEEKSEKNSDTKNTIQVFGKEFCLEEEGSLCFFGVFLGLADGINPCMFSVLTFLLVYLMGIGSSKKALKAGLAFTVTTFLFYLLFMYGLIKVIDVLKIAKEVRMAVSIFALLAGLVMVKDYFFYGRWFSFEISDKVKPTLEKLTKKGTVMSAIILALLASLVELPCTSGIPLAYVSILSTKDVFILGYLVLYNLFFVIPLLTIVLGTIFVWKKVEKVEKWKEDSKKYMRLIAGILLILLAVAIWNGWF